MRRTVIAVVGMVMLGAVGAHAPAQATFDCYAHSGSDPGAAWFTDVAYWMAGSGWTSFSPGERAEIPGSAVIRYTLHLCNNEEADASNNASVKFSCTPNPPGACQNRSWNDHIFAPYLPVDTDRVASRGYQYNLDAEDSGTFWQLEAHFDDGEAPNDYVNEDETILVEVGA
jgi:hypothetical protein